MTPLVVAVNVRLALVPSTEAGAEPVRAFARNADHCDRAVKVQTLPQALEWVWQGPGVDTKLTR